MVLSKCRCTDVHLMHMHLANVDHEPIWKLSNGLERGSEARSRVEQHNSNVLLISPLEVLDSKFLHRVCKHFGCSAKASEFPEASLTTTQA